MSIHNDPRRVSTDDDEYREWQNDLRTEYAQEEYERTHPYSDIVEEDCEFRNECGECECDGACIYQRGKWKDMCGLDVEDEESLDLSCHSDVADSDKGEKQDAE